MRIAICSDIHGNPYALEAVLDAIEGEGALDRIIIAGDLVFGGSGPARCVELLRAAGTEAVYGNTDEFVHSPDRTPGDQQHLKKWEAIQADAAWTAGKLGDDALRWLAGLPFDITLDPGGKEGDRLLVFHANPVDVEGVLYPGPEVQKELFGRVRQPDNDPQLAAWLDPVTAGTLVFGHFHFSSERRVRGKRLVNVASVSMPAVDRDPRAQYAVFTWTRNTWELSRRYVDYDYTQEVAALRASGMPNWEMHARAFT